MSATKTLKRSATAANITDSRVKAPKQTRLSFEGVKVFEDDEIRPETKPKAKKTGKAKVSASQKLYKDTISSIDKEFMKLYRQYEANPTPMYGVTADDFAKQMATLLPTLEELGNESPLDAFNVLMYLGDHAYGELEACCKSSGWGNSEELFIEMDDTGVALIAKVLAAKKMTAANGVASTDASETKPYVVAPSTSDMGTEWRELLDLFGTGQLNKQKRGWLKKARLMDLKHLFELRKERRESTADWTGNALNDLMETRDRIEGYGLGEYFFAKTIALLASEKGVQVLPIRYSSHY